MENLTLEFVSGLVLGAYYASDLEIEDEKTLIFGSMKLTNFLK